MKKLILISGLLFLSFQVYSQTEKGTTMIGTRFNIYQNKQESESFLSSTNYAYTNKGFNIGLNGGYFIKNHLALGLFVSYAGQSTENIDKSSNGDAFKNTNTNDSKVYSLGLYARAYKMMLDNKIAFFGQFNATYSFGKSNSLYTQMTNGTVQSEQKTNGDISGISFGISPGVSYFINQRIGLEISFGNLSYSTQTTKTSSSGTQQFKNKTSGFNLNFTSSTLVLGINFYFTSKKE